MQVEDRPIVETVAATGTNVLESIKNLVHQGNTRRIVVKQMARPLQNFRSPSVWWERRSRQLWPPSEQSQLC
jgi:hypothetical protein